MTDEQREALENLRREYLTNVYYGEGMDGGTQDRIEGVLTAFGLSLECTHDFEDFGPYCQACRICGMYVANDDIPTAAGGKA